MLFSKFEYLGFLTTQKNNLSKNKKFWKISKNLQNSKFWKIRSVVFDMTYLNEIINNDLKEGSEAIGVPLVGFPAT